MPGSIAPPYFLLAASVSRSGIQSASAVHALATSIFLGAHLTAVGTPGWKLHLQTSSPLLVPYTRMLLSSWPVGRTGGSQLPGREGHVMHCRICTCHCPCSAAPAIMNCLSGLKEASSGTPVVPWL